MKTPGTDKVNLCLRVVLVSSAIAAALPAVTGAARPRSALGATASGRRDSIDALRSGPGTSNHPVGVIPSSDVQVPPGWPLDPEGSLTCKTCHETLPRLDRRDGPHLRDFDEATDEPISFCAKCHTRTDGRTAPSMHWLAVRVAHVQPSEYDSRRGGATVDAESRRCLQCHDGVTAAESLNPTTSHGAGNSYAERGRNHPVGIAYRPGQPGRRTSLLRPAALLPSQVRLPEGKVSCVSCHDLYARQSGLLTVPIEGSQLCFACHEMD